MIPDLNPDEDEEKEEVYEGTSTMPSYDNASDTFDANEQHYYIDTMDYENVYACDTCDKNFNCEYAYENHVKEHTTCSVDGCTFTAHEKIVANHVKTQHSTGLYDTICKLSTPEDIRRWKEERKRNYPTRENIAKRQERQVEMLERGERLFKSKDGRRSKQKLRYTRKRNVSKIKTQKRTPIKKKSLINEKDDWNGTMFPFKGTVDLYKIQPFANATNFEDEEWEQKHTCTKVTMKNALGSLMSAYNDFSEDSDCENTLSIAKETKRTSQKEISRKDLGERESDGELPTEMPIDKSSIFETNEKASDGIKEEVADDNAGFKKNNKRKRVHKSKGKDVRARKDLSQNKRDGRDDKPFVKRRTTLLERLLENEIRHERNVILQCVRYVVKNNYFGD